MKKIAPTVITIITVIYLGAYSYVLFFVVPDFVGIAKILLAFVGLVVLCILAAMLYTLRQRLKEIDKEDKDDLSKY